MFRAPLPTLPTLFILTALACLGGCGSNGGGAVIDGGGGQVVGDGGGMFLTCETDTRAMPYARGMQVTSIDGTFTLKLLDSRPGPPVKGNNVWTVEVDEAATGLPLEGLDLTVSPYMPDHMHSSVPVVVTPTVTEAGTSGYSLQPVYLFMSGVWQVKFVIVGLKVGAGVTETATIPICIP